MIIRQAREEDVMQIAEIVVEDWKTAYRGMIDDDYLDSLSVEQRYQIEIKRYLKYCEIIALYVRYSKRNHGIGRALMQDSMDCFRKAGKKSMIIWCLRDNQESRKFYVRMGGKKYKDGTHRWGNREYDMVSYLYDLDDNKAY